MSTATYYFDASDAAATDPNGVWTNDANAFDGSTSTSASVDTTGSTSSNFLMAEGTNAPATAPGTGTDVLSVRARVYADTTSGDIDPDIRAAIYTDGLAELLGTPVKAGAVGWGNYATLAIPTGGWTWAKVQSLETKIYRISGVVPGVSNVYRVEVEVTYKDLGSAVTAWLRV